MSDTEDHPAANGDACPRCGGINTFAITHWEEPGLVCDDCGYGT